MTTPRVAAPLPPRPATPRGSLEGLLPNPVVVGRAGPPDQSPGVTEVSADSLTRHHERWGARPRGGPWLLEAARAAGLTGCGGGHFPAAEKWHAALARSRPITLVANAAESEPLSAKDATLLRLRPHLVLDGLATLAETLDACAPVLWLHDDDPVTWRAVLEAVLERQRVGLDEPPVTVRAVAPAYLSGESSAIKQALAGGPVLPGFQRAGASAAVGGPVVVHNVETLAQVSRLRPRRGPAAPTDRAEVKTSAIRLLTILTARDRRVVGLPVDTRLDEAVLLATGARVPPTATALLGGFGGLWVRWSDVAGSPVDESVLRSSGYTLGPGIVAPLWEPGCGVAVTAAITAYLADASARQCGPCLFGLRALADRLEGLRTGHARRRELRRLHDDLSAVAGRGACHHPDGAVRLVRSALEVFADDVAAHVHGAPCPESELPIPVPGTNVAEA